MRIHLRFRTVIHCNPTSGGADRHDVATEIRSRQEQLLLPGVDARYRWSGWTPPRRLNIAREHTSVTSRIDGTGV